MIRALVKRRFFIGISSVILPGKSCLHVSLTMGKDNPFIAFVGIITVPAIVYNLFN